MNHCLICNTLPIFAVTFDGLQFRGVLFQGRLLDDPDTPVGTFEVVDPGMLQLACNNVSLHACNCL